MTLDKNKAVVERFVREFWSSGKLSTADELMATDARISVNNQAVPDIETLKAICRSIREAFPAWHSTLEELLAEGERVAERWTGRGTHQGAFQGIAATGRQVAVPGTVTASWMAKSRSSAASLIAWRCWSSLAVGRYHPPPDGILPVTMPV